MKFPKIAQAIATELFVRSMCTLPPPPLPEEVSRLSKSIPLAPDHIDLLLEWGGALLTKYGLTPSPTFDEIRTTSCLLTTTMDLSSSMIHLAPSFRKTPTAASSRESPKALENSSTRYSSDQNAQNFMEKIGFKNYKSARWPNKTPEPTRGTDAILFFQSRWPRVAQLKR